MSQLVRQTPRKRPRRITACGFESLLFRHFTLTHDGDSGSRSDPADSHKATGVVQHGRTLSGVAWRGGRVCLIAHDWKSCRASKPSWVKIPPFPPTSRMPRSVKAAQGFLIPLDGVRFPAGQPNDSPIHQVWKRFPNSSRGRSAHRA